MNHESFESGYSSEPQERVSFLDKLKELIPGVEFEESDDLRQARLDVLAALERGVGILTSSSLFGSDTLLQPSGLSTIKRREERSTKSPGRLR